MKKIHYIFKLLIVIFFISGYIGCQNTPVEPESPAFNDTEKIELLSPAHTGTISWVRDDQFMWTNPSNVDVIIIALFNDTTIPLNQELRQIADDTNWYAGSTSDFPDMSGGIINIQDFRAYNQGTGLYENITIADIPNNPYTWFVYAYKDGQVTHSSPVFTVNINHAAK